MTHQSIFERQQAINKNYYSMLATATAPNKWLSDYSNILLKESQNFYVPSQASPFKLNNSVNASFNSTFSYSNDQVYSQHYNRNYYQSSPCQNSYNFYNSFSDNSFSQNEFSSNSPTGYTNPNNFEPESSSSSFSLSNSHEIADHDKVKNNKMKASRKKFLSDKATDILNEWYDEHQNNPYPLQEEKERLAKLADVTVKQVSAWFSNRRNRTQNTKPKRMRRVLEKEINLVFSKIIDDQPDSQHIINRLKSTIESSYSPN